MNSTTASQHIPRKDPDHPYAGGLLRVLPGGAATPKTHVLRAPRVKVLFEQNGRPRVVEWSCAESVNRNGVAPARQSMLGENALSFTVQDPASRLTWVDVEGLSLVDSGERRDRRVEPYRITDVASSDGGFSTTHSSVLAYRIREGCAPAETRLARVTAAFAQGSSLRLFFLYADSAGNPGRVTVLADVEKHADAFACMTF